MVQTTDEEHEVKPKARRAPTRTAKSKRTPEEVDEISRTADPDEQDPGFVSARSPELDTPRWNSMPHPELWPSPDTSPDAEPREDDEDAVLRCVPPYPNVNFEFTLKGSGLPVSTGTVWKLEGADGTGSPTFFTPKTDPFGDCHVVWRSQKAGTLRVTITGKRDHALTDEALASLDVTILDPANDRRFGEERGQA